MDLDGPKNRGLDGVRMLPFEGAILRGGRPVVKYRDSPVSCAKPAEPIEIQFGLRTGVDPRNDVLDESPDPCTQMGNFDGKKGPAQDMPGRVRLTSMSGQSDSERGRNGMVQMPIGCTRMECTLAPPGEYH